MNYLQLAAQSSTALRQWREEMGISQREAADGLGLALKNYQFLEWGENRSIKGSPRPAVMSKRVALACAAIKAGLVPIEGWTDEMANTRKAISMGN